MEILLVYLWMQLPSIEGVFIAILIMLFITLLSLLFQLPTKPYIYKGGEELVNELKPKIKRVFLWMFAPILILGLIPSKQSVAVMVGTYYTKEAVTSPEGQKVLSLIRKKTNELLDAELKETVKK